MALRRKRKTDAEATAAPEVPEAESPAATATPAADAEIVADTPTSDERYAEAAERRPVPTHDDEW